jgi:hypothetical protein
MLGIAATTIRMTTTEIALQMSESTLTYFQGEKIEALVFILPVGLLSLVFAAWLLTDNGNAFTRGVAIPFLLMGVLMTVVGAVVGYRTPSQVRALEVALKGEPTAIHAAQVVESARMSKVNNAWKFYLIGWAALGVLGLLMRFATRSDFMQGLGIAMVFFCGVGLLVDGFAERRAHIYAATLSREAEPPSVNFAP